MVQPGFGLASAVIAALCSGVLVGCGEGRTATSSAQSSATSAPTSATRSATAQTRTVTVTTTRAARPISAPGSRCRREYRAEYVGEVFCYLRLAGVRNDMINNDCGPLLADRLRGSGSACLNDLTGYEALLNDAQHDLRLRDLDTVPPGLHASAAWLSRAVSDDLAAAQLAIEGVHAHDLFTFLKAWGVHARAGRELQTAGHLFSNG